MWAQDEARFGLKPILRRVWARKGCRPQAVQKPGYKWLYVYGFVEPASGESTWLVLPTVSVAAFSLSLKAFAEEHGVNEENRVLLILDRAGWHLSAALVLPPGIHLLHQPPYSPQLQPAERLWPLLNQTVANRCFDALDEMITVISQRCRVLAQQTQRLQSLTLFHWWADALQIR